MLFRKQQPPLPAPPNNSVSVKFGPMIEVKADGWGLLVAPVIIVAIAALLILGASLGGSAMVDGIGDLVRASQASPEEIEKPPPGAG